MFEEPPSAPKKKDKMFPVRMDEDLYLAASRRAKRFGGLAAVIRALLKLFVQGELDSPLQTMTPEERRRPPRRQPPEE